MAGLLSIFLTLVHVVACISTSYLFITNNILWSRFFITFCLSIYQLICIGLFLLFWLLEICYHIYTHIVYEFLSGRVFIFLDNTRRGIVGLYCNSVFNYREELSDGISEAATRHRIFPPAVCEDYNFSTSLPVLTRFCFGHPSGNRSGISL